MSERVFNDSNLGSGGVQHFRRSSIDFHKNLAVGRSAFVNEIKELGGIRPQDIIVLHKCDAYDNANYGTWVVTGGFSAVATGAIGPANNNGSTGTCVQLTSSTTDGRAYFNLASPKNLIGKKYIGFYINTPATKDWDAGDLKLELYSDGNTLTITGDNYKTFDFPAYQGASTNAFRYFAIDISSAPDSLLRNVTRIGISGLINDATGNINIYLMEAFYWGYKYTSSPDLGGPARGIILEGIVAPGSTAIVNGNALMYNEDGYVETITPASSNEGRVFAGVALEAADASATYDGSVTVKFVADGVINRSAGSAIKFLQSVYANGVVSIAASTGGGLNNTGYALSPANGRAGVIPILIRPHGYGYIY